MTAFVALALLAQQPTSPTLTLVGNDLVVKLGDRQAKVPAKPGPKVSAIRTTYRKDETFVHWDATGVHVQKGEYDRSTRLPDAALSPKLFSREEILKSKNLISQGKRKKDCSFLSGSARLGSDVFLLLRWEDSENKPWLEALFKVDLNAAKPAPVLLGKFDGISLATGNADSRLHTRRDGLFVLGRLVSGDWGVGFYDPKTAKFAFAKRGTGLVSYDFIEGGMIVGERTDYGKVRFSQMTLLGQGATVLAELKPGTKLMADAVPYFAIAPSNLGQTLRNLDTGATMLLPVKPQVKRTEFGLLVWPEADPSKAVLYSNERFVRLAAAKVEAAPPVQR